jgi:hypothetical protein
MKLSVRKPSIFNLLDNITNSILSHITIDNYFNFTKEKKLATQYFVLKYIKTKLNSETLFKDEDIKATLSILIKKNEETENYEFAAILTDIYNNFNAIDEFTKTAKPQLKSKIKSKLTNK